MKKLTYLILSVALLVACREAANPFVVKEKISEQIDSLWKCPIKPTNADSMLHRWLILSKNQQVRDDSALFARVNYNLGRLYGMRGHDSASFFLDLALEYAEPLDGYLVEKAYIYNGLGNIWSMRAKDHQASYYYNQAASIVMADSSLDLSADAKSVMLVSAAQSNGRLYQYRLAQEMNFAALTLRDDLPEGHINLQRPLTQMIQTLHALDKPSDSLKYYLEQLENLQARYPEQYDIAYLYESKTKYFEQTRQYDSLMHYQLLKCARDEQVYQAKPQNQTVINNLFISYSNLAGTYILDKDTDNARRNLKNAAQLLALHDSLIMTDNLIFYKTNVASLDDLMGSSHAAVEAMLEVNQLQKQNFETENMQAVAEMSSLYQLQAKDRSIAVLNEGMKINALQLQQNRLWLTISLLTVGLLLSIFLFFVYRNRQRRETSAKERVLLQQQLLRTQMEPHFIFNTLAAVQSFVRLDKKEHAIKYLNRFSKLLRSSLELSRENLVPLDQEIEALDNYISLQQMRFEKAFEYEIVPPSFLDYDMIMLPPMLIQPFVENAIIHGVDLTQDTAFIQVHFSIKNNLLDVMIVDSGKVMDEYPDAQHRSMSGAISSERMRLLGKDAQIRSTHEPNGGTRVHLTIPISSP